MNGASVLCKIVLYIVIVIISKLYNQKDESIKLYNSENFVVIGVLIVHNHSMFCNVQSSSACVVGVLVLSQLRCKHTRDLYGT